MIKVTAVCEFCQGEGSNESPLLLFSDTGALGGKTYICTRCDEDDSTMYSDDNDPNFPCSCTQYEASCWAQGCPGW